MLSLSHILLSSHPSYACPREAGRLSYNHSKTSCGEKNTEKRDHGTGGKWEGVASPKEMGGLGIINPMAHASALCAKLFVSLASSNQKLGSNGQRDDRPKPAVLDKRRVERNECGKQAVMPKRG